MLPWLAMLPPSVRAPPVATKLLMMPLGPFTNVPLATVNCAL